MRKISGNGGGIAKHANSFILKAIGEFIKEYV